jgi:hypothetical protein
MNSPPLSCGRKPWKEGSRRRNRELNLSGKPKISKKSFDNGKLNGKINTKISVLQLWKELKREIHDALFVFFNDVPRKSTLEPYKNIIS